MGGVGGGGKKKAGAKVAWWQVLGGRVERQRGLPAGFVDESMGEARARR